MPQMPGSEPVLGLWARVRRKIFWTLYKLKRGRIARAVRERKKVRYRTAAELEERFEGLVQTARILDRFGLRWHVSGGTVLGMVRDGDFIHWDWDVGFGMKLEEVMPRRKELLGAFLDAGFALRFDSSNKLLEETIEFDWKGQHMELLLWTSEGEWRRRKTQKRPARFFDTIEHRSLRGQNFPVPSPTVEYLEFLYGDWRTPKRTANKSVYRTSQASA